MKRSHQIIFASIGLLIFALNSRGQEGPPLALGDFETQGSVTFGYRFTDIRGREQKFLELYNLKQGPRMMDFSLTGRARAGTSPFADSFSLSTSGLGGDPFPSAQLTVRKNKLYDLRVNYRQAYYYWDRDDTTAIPTSRTLPGLGLTTNHDWSTVRRFASVNFLLHATNNLSVGFEYQRTSRDGMTQTTRNLDYSHPSGAWGSFARANAYAIGVPLDELANRFTGILAYTVRDWMFHYRLGYQTFDQNLTGSNLTSPQRSIDPTITATANELATNISFQEFRRLKTPVSEFSYKGKATSRLDLRGGYIFYRYQGPASREAAYSGDARTNSGGTTFAPYSLSDIDRAHLTEANHVIDQGLSLRLTDWWNFHADYRYMRSIEEAEGEYHSTFTQSGVTTIADSAVDTEWILGTHQLNLNFEFIPVRSLVVRTGVRLMKRDIKNLEDGDIDPLRAKQIKTAWPTASISFRPSSKFSVRGDIQSMTNGASYTRISPHTDVGTRIIVRYQPWSRLSIEDNLVIRNREFVDTDFKNNMRTNGLNVSYSFTDQISGFAGFSYDSYMATAGTAFIRGTAVNGVPCLTTAPCPVTWSDRFVSRIWQGGLSARANRYVGLNISGNFVRTTGLSQISEEVPTYGGMRWPLITGTFWGEIPRAGRISLDLQRTYYREDIVHANDFRGNLLTIRWTRDF